MIVDFITSKSSKSASADEIRYELTPIIVKDAKTGFFFAFYEQFPRASAVGKTKQEAESSLQDIFKIMLKEHEQEIVAEVLKFYPDFVTHNA